MIRAVIDAPWVLENDTWGPDYDGPFRDVTGQDWWGDPPRKGGNYPGGDPDYLMIEVTVEDDAALEALDADDRYWVYWSEEISEDPAVRAAPYRDKNSQPDPNTWGQFRSKLARRGFSQQFIDTYFDKREIMWGDHDHNGRQGYLGWNDIVEPDPEPVDIVALVRYLVDEGWEASGDVIITVHDSGVTYEATQEWLQGCDYSSLDNKPLARDLCQGMQEQGFCRGGCS